MSILGREQLKDEEALGKIHDGIYVGTKLQHMSMGDIFRTERAWASKLQECDFSLFLFLMELFCHTHAILASYEFVA